jgi:transcriptional regulator with XRE-family HTH domain
LYKNLLRAIREGKGISQLKLSRITGIAPGTISNIENGKIVAYPGWKRRLSAALGVPEAVIFPEYAEKEE